MLISLIFVAGVAIFAAFFLANRQVVPVEREGIVKEVLNKDAFSVEFDDGRPTIVRLYGLAMACESEMMGDKIFDLLNKEVRGGRVRVKPRRVLAGDVIVGEIHLLTGEYLNAIMIRQGFARWSASEAAEDRELAQAQETAKSEQLGVWNPAVRQLLVGRLRDQAGEEGEGEDSQVEPHSEELAKVGENTTDEDPASIFSTHATDLNPKAN